MNFTYENQGTNTYLVYTVSAEENIDSMSLGMLTNNKIPGLASTLFTQMDSAKYIKYNVSAHIPVSQFFAGAVNKKRLLGVFKGVVSAILSAEDYMIDESSIQLDLDCIFADVTTCDTVLICLPIEHEAQRHDLGAFFKGIMFSTQFDQTESCDYVAKIINYLNSSPLFSLSDFNELLEKLEKDEGNSISAVQPVVPQPVKPQERVESAAVVQPQAPVQQPVVPVNKAEPVQSGAMFGTTGVPYPTPSEKDHVLPTFSVSQSGETGTNKGFSLFGFLSSKSDKKESKSQTVKPAAKAMPKTSFEVPSQTAPQMAFEVPGQTASKMAFEVPSQPAAAVTQPAVPQEQVKYTQQPQVTRPEPAAVSAPNAAAAQPANMPISFGETIVLSGAIGETTVLGGGGANETIKTDPHLVRAKNNEKIPLNKPVFRIGKERSYVDYFISDNTAISRSHANIINHNGEFFVVDTNSTNHTYVNGGMIQSGMETKLAHGTKIRFANEDFEFKMY